MSSSSSVLIIRIQLKTGLILLVFEASLACNTGVELKHLRYRLTLKALLHFIYWDALPDLQELVGLDTKWAVTLMAQHLLAAADQYGLERLRALCEAKLCEDVTINTVATTLALADQHHCVQLKAVCLKFIALPENLKAVMQSEGFDHLNESCPSVISELLNYVAGMHEHAIISYVHGGHILDGTDVNGRRVKQRIY